MIKVLMNPHVSQLGKRIDGISQVVAGYFRHLPDFDVELVGQNATSYDLRAVHVQGDGEVLHNHGLYWTSDYPASQWEYEVNAKVISSARYAKQITVPSPWVAEAFQRDMRLNPHIVPHGIDWEDWQHNESCEGYVLWAKNRTGDVCDTNPLSWLASSFQDVSFKSTQPAGTYSNLQVIGLIPHKDFKKVVQKAGIYLATTKETFGIGILEAMASGVPILGFAHGGALDLVRHGVNGYLAGPSNYEDLANGLSYCLQHRKTLGDNGREMARAWTWGKACEKVANVYKLALTEEKPTVAIVIPCFNYAQFLDGAIASAVMQDYPMLAEIIIVNDGSEDDTEKVAKEWVEKDGRVIYIKQPNSGVAVARNRGIETANTKYICCLDADDRIEPNYLSSLIPTLESDRSIGVAYSGMMLHYANGKSEAAFIKNCNFDEHLKGIDGNGQSHNQVPTCCVFRREAWKRLGGYRQRYAPSGCGTEDAEFWTRVGAYGFEIKLGTDKPLFHYTMGGRTFQDGHETVNYTDWHPWSVDEQHPFASIAKPKHFSHPVRQYDEPIVSVVIPVGPGHETDVINALDSLEAQTFRKWEVVLFWDSEKRGQPLDFIRSSYPYVKLHFEGEARKGAGYARNVGARAARASLLLFLDADDWLYPECLSLMVQAMSDFGYEAIVYSDYTRLSVIEQGLADDLRKKGRLLEYRSDGHAVIQSFAFDYDEQRALRQPEANDPYIWNLISSLVPSDFFHEIGGFDAEMESFEDWDFWLRMAQHRKTFIRIPKPLVVYRMYSGNRREEGSQIAPHLIRYMRAKYGLDT